MLVFQVGLHPILEPLAEIAPEFVDPVSGKTIRQLLEEVSDPARVERLR